MIFTLCLFILGLLTNSSDVQRDTETRNLDKFTAVEVSGNITLTLVQSDEHKAEIELVKGDLSKLVTDVRGNTLKVKFKNKDGWNWGGNQNKANITLYFADIEILEASAGASVGGDDTIQAEEMSLDASSGASVRIDLECNNLDVDVSSGASLRLKGSTETQKADVSSGASYNGVEMIAEKVKIDASSGASAKVFASKEIKAEASSGGSIKYKGDPDKTNLDPGRYSGGSIKSM